MTHQLPAGPALHQPPGGPPPLDAVNAAYLTQARTIMRDFTGRLKTDSAFAALTPDQQLDYYHKQQPQFARMFAVPLRYMIIGRRFSSAAFAKYLTRLNTHPFKSEDEYYMRQADYVRYLVAARDRSHDPRKAQAAWDQTYQGLAAEAKSFKEAHAAIQERAKKVESDLSIQRRDELRALCLKIRQGSAPTPTSAQSLSVTPLP